MKLHKVLLPVLIFGTGYTGAQFAHANVMPPDDDPVQWMRCCERKGNYSVPPCSSTTTKEQCYKSCQVKCGDPDSINGKKCRQFCNINFS